jgi:hypothetical protein
VPTLNGRQVQQLSDGLLDAFPDADELEMFLDVMLDKRLAELAPPSVNNRIRVYKLIRAADAQGWVLQLVSAARQARPGNAAVREVAEQVGLAAAPASQDQDGQDQASRDQTSLERIILASAPFLDVSTWRAQLGELEAQVCRVEVPAGLKSTVGTGFLVGPDLCLTNFHVVKVLVDRMADPRQTRLRFDYRRAEDGTVVDPGTEFHLAHDWLVAGRPPSAVDELADPGTRLPAPDELDFALLRVRESPGEQPIGRAEGLPDAPRRGWIRQAGADGFAAGHPLLVLQHPEDAPLKLAFGQSDGLNANATRLRHQVNTRPGSSGSPCLNAKLELVALHHAGDPNFAPGHHPAYNAAVPIAAIRDYLAGLGIGLAFG